MLLFADMDARC